MKFGELFGGVATLLVFAAVTHVDGQAECTLCQVLELVTNMNAEITSLKKEVSSLKATNEQLSTLGQIKTALASLSGMTADISSLKEYVRKVDSTQQILVEQSRLRNNARDCADLFKSGISVNGIFDVYPRDGQGPIKMLCDMTTDGGGWTVIQNRFDGSVDFYRGWKDYKNGFGSLKSEFWLGNDYIHLLTSQGAYAIRFDLEDTSGTEVYAAYNRFSITSEETNYKLTVGNYSGNAGDSFKTHSGAQFSTKDKDNDVHDSGSCAVSYKGAWWYKKCHSSNLNGKYYNGPHTSYADGIEWYTFKGHHYSLRKTSMKIRPVDFKPSY